MKKEIISTNRAPQAIGPYSQAIKVGNMIYTSGMLAILPENGSLIGDDISLQTEQVLKNLSELLNSVSSSLNNVIKTTVFIKDMNDFATINEVYKKYFSENCPARSCVEVSRLPAGALIEIECIALLD